MLSKSAFIVYIVIAEDLRLNFRMVLKLKIQLTYGLFAVKCLIS